MSNFVISTNLPGVLLIEPRVFRDARGFFVESYHQLAFHQVGLTDNFVQDNHSRSSYGVLRGLHYQDMTAPMAKLVRCTRGAVFDVAVDLRHNSPTFGQWFGVELSEKNFKQLYVPVGFAHGFAVITEVAEVQYKCSNFYSAQSEGSIKWDDPEIGIIWPITNPTLSARDRAAQSLSDYQQSPAFHYATPSAGKQFT